MCGELMILGEISNSPHTYSRRRPFSKLNPRERGWSIYSDVKITLFEFLPARVNHRAVNRRLSTAVWVSTALSTVRRQPSLWEST